MSELALQLIAENKRTQAKILDLGNCGLKELPEELFELTWLEELNICNGYYIGGKFIQSQNSDEGNCLSEISRSIERLQNIQVLRINALYYSQWNITDISPLKNLKKLTVLDLHGNKIRNADILENLIQLKYLNIHSNQVSDISFLRKLINLQTLNLAKNSIRNIPNLDNLSQISYLDFRSNQISDINALKKLFQTSTFKRLDISLNKIKDLTPILPLIKRGIPIKWDSLKDGICVQDNPFMTPPVEIVQQGNEAILKYFEDKAKQGEEKLYEAKIVVVGAGESGKTTLIQKMLNPQHPVPNPKDKRTEGIKVTTYPFCGEVEGASKDLTAYLWDFGGQELYHATHQFFLTPDTLYVLLNDNRKNDTDFYYWLNILRLRAGNDCPILMVFNAKDKSPRQIVPNKQLFEAFPSVVQEAVDIDFANKNFRVFEDLKQKIESHFANLEVLGRPYPKLWVEARETLGALKEEHITWTHFEEICAKKGITDEDSKQILAQTLHNLGVLLYFPDVFGLENLVILQPQWCTDAIYKVFDLPIIVENHGRFNEQTLAKCWSQDKRFRGHSLQLLKLMQQFDLCYWVEGTQNEYIAPQLLSLEENFFPDFPQQHAIRVRLDYTFMPAGMITSFIARMSQHILAPHVWRTGVTLQWEEGTMAEVTEQAFSRQINIRVVGPERQRRLSDIRKTLQLIHQRFRGLKYEESVACNCRDCDQQPDATWFEFSELADNAKYDDPMTCRKGTRKKIPAKRILEGIAYTDYTRIFISYSHKNEALKNEFRAMIRPLERRGDWRVWDDRYLLPGDNWNEKILRHLSEANVIVLLLTADFFNSDFIYNIEFSRAIQRHESGDALVVGVVVSDCLWEETPLRKIQLVPKDAKPVERHPHRSKVWKEVAKRIREAIARREERNRKEW